MTLKFNSPKGAGVNAIITQGQKNCIINPTSGRRFVITVRPESIGEQSEVFGS